MITFSVSFVVVPVIASSVSFAVVLAILFAVVLGLLSLCGSAGDYFQFAVVLGITFSLR